MSKKMRKKEEDASSQPQPEETSKKTEASPLKKGAKNMKSAKKVDPEVLKSQFEDWKQTEEYQKWIRLYEKKAELKKEYEHDVTETNEDLTGDWQDFEDKLFDFCKTYKVKTKLKEIKHEHVRSFFFARENKDGFNFDGILAGVSREVSDKPWHLRQAFVAVWRSLDDINDMDPSNFVANKKKMAKDLSEFMKQLAPYIKTGHKEIYEDKLATVLRPLTNLLKTNMRFSAFEAEYDTPEAREIVSFKHKSLIDEFCKDLQECLRILHNEKEAEKRLVANPHVQRIFNKLDLEGWKDNKIESFYLCKLRNAFFSMRNHLIKLFVKGINHWKIPLSANQKFLEDAKGLVDCELISERLLGDDLKRDQLNFVHSTLSVINETPAKEQLEKKEEAILKNAVPKLLIFKTIQKMRGILDMKLEEQKSKEIEKKQGGIYFKMQISGILEDEKDSIDENKSILSRNLVKSMSSPKQKKEDLEEEKKKLEDAEIKRYGRFWMWENYLEESSKAIMIEAVDSLRHVNIAVQQDIQDVLITEGLNIPASLLEHREKYREEVKRAREKLDNLNREHNKRDEVNNIRPPILWNHPNIVEKDHIFRSIAAPQECYRDSRIQDLMEKIQFLGNQLSTNQKGHYDELISRVIDFFNGKYNNKPNPLSIY